MKVVVGLGNPGRQYVGTRHNVGFEVVEHLAQRLGETDGWRRDFHSELMQTVVGNEIWLLVKPQTYMNRSGLAVATIVRFYQLPLTDLLVVCDDLNLPLGQLRLRAEGSHGGHKGLRDVQQELGTPQYPRLRIGIGSPPPGQDAADYVLERFRPEERPVVAEAVQRATQAILCWLKEGIEAAMNRFNVRQSKANKKEQAQERNQSNPSG